MDLQGNIFFKNPIVICNQKFNLVYDCNHKNGFVCYLVCCVLFYYKE